MTSPHVLILPMPFQGHIMPLMEMAHHLIDAGFTVTFVNTDFNHRRLLSAAADGAAAFSTASGRLHLLGIPDGLGSDEARKDVGLMCKLIASAMSPGLDSIIRAAAAEGRPIHWILADQNMAWAFPSAVKLGLRAAAFWPASTAVLALGINIPKLIEIGVIGEDGLPKKNEFFRLAAGIPALHTSQLAWNMAGNSVDKSAIFSFVTNNNRATAEHAAFIICNTFVDLEPEAISLLPAAVPIGPLFPAEHHPLGNLWPPANSSAVLEWLDSHSPASVLYIAFGSHAIFDKAQVEELARGLEMTGRPFLWAVRPDLITAAGCSKDDDVLSACGLPSSVKGRALLVGWAPQQQVLAHPSVGCFMSHCGWNSTLEGIRNGVPFLCWPYFTDQFMNQSYICDTWRIGKRVGPDDDDEEESGGSRIIIIISRERIREKVEEVMRDDEMRERASVWKQRARQSVSNSSDGGGTSFHNFKRIVAIFEATKPYY